MKKFVSVSLTVLAIVLLTVCSCTKASKEQNFDESHIYGTWTCSDGYDYDFSGDHSGRSYEPDDRKHGLDFTWKLSGDQLQLVFTGEKSGVATKSYIVTVLTGNAMECYDITDRDDKLTFHRK